MGSKVTFYRRGEAIRDKEGKVIGYEKGKKGKEYETSRKFIISAEGRTKRKNKEALVERRIKNEPRTKEEAKERRLAREAATPAGQKREALQQIGREQGIRGVIGALTGDDIATFPRENRADNQQQRFSNDRFENKFFSVAGQKERLSNVRAVYAEIGNKGIFGNLALEVNAPRGSLAAKNPVVKKAVKEVVTNPGTTALAITGAAGAFRTGSLATASTITKVGVGAAQVTGTAVGTSFVASRATLATTTTPLQQEILQDRAVQEAFGSTIQRQAQKQQGIGKFTFGLSILADRDINTFRSIARDELESRGITGARQDAAVRALERQRFSRGFGEVAGLLAASAQTELLGRSFQAGFQAKYGVGTTFRQGFIKTFAPISKAGFAEGFGAEIAQQSARGEKISLGKAGAVGTIGAASAGVIGGTIGGFSASGSKVRRVFVERAADVLDPFEAPGDVTAAAFSKGFSRVPVAAITPSITPSFTTSVNTPAVAATGTPVSTPTPNVAANINTFVDARSNIGTGVPTPSTTPTPTQTIIPSNIITPSQTITSTAVTTPTATTTPTITPVVTPQTFFIPFVPSLGGGGGFGAKRRRKGKRGKKTIKTPGTLIGQTFNIGLRTRKGGVYSGLGVRR